MVWCESRPLKGQQIEENPRAREGIAERGDTAGPAWRGSPRRGFGQMAERQTAESSEPQSHPNSHPPGPHTALKPISVGTPMSPVRLR
jgi:hypothetical protein